MARKMADYYAAYALAPSPLIWKYDLTTLADCVEAFEKAKIFDGKTIYEAEKDIEVLFG